MTESPFADQAGCVAGIFQDLGNGDVIGAKIRFCVSSNITVSRVLSGHQHTSRRCANGRAGVKLCEPPPFGGHPVDVRRFDLFLPVTAYVTVAQIVGHNEDDVWFLIGFERFAEVLVSLEKGESDRDDDSRCRSILCTNG